MSDIRSFFGGGGGSKNKKQPEPTAAVAKGTKPAAASDSKAASTKKTKQQQPVSASASATSSAAGRVKVKEAGQLQTAASSSPSSSASTAAKAGEKKKTSSYFAHLDGEDEDDVFVVERTRSRSSASPSRSSRNAQEAKKKQTGSRTKAARREDEDDEYVPEKGRRRDDGKDAEAMQDDEDEDAAAEFDDDELPRRRSKQGRGGEKRRRTRVLVDDDERVYEAEEEREEEGEKKDGKDAEAAAETAAAARITQHFTQTPSQKQRLKEEKEREDTQRAEQSRQRQAREAVEAAEREKEMKAEALRERRRRGVVDEDVAFAQLDAHTPDTSVPAAANRAGGSGQRGAGAAAVKQPIDPAAYFDEPQLAIKAKPSARSEHQTAAASCCSSCLPPAVAELSVAASPAVCSDRAQAAKQTVDVVDVEMEAAADASSGAEQRRRRDEERAKMEEESLRVAMRLQAEEDERARRQQPASSSSSGPHTPSKKRLKEEKQDDDEDGGNTFGSHKRRKTTPVKESTASTAASSSSASSSSPSKKRTPSKKTPTKAAVKKEAKKAAAEHSASSAAEDDAYADEDKKAAAAEKKKKSFLAMKAIANRPLSLGVVKEMPEGAPGCLQAQTFVISGVLDSLDREAAKTLIERYGGRVTGSVSGKTSFLILGQEAGETKRKQAEKLGTPIIDEDGLLELIRTRKGHALGAEAAATAQAATAKAKKAQSSAQTAAQGVTASVNATTSKGREQLRVHGKTAERAEDMLWVDKHRPLRLADIIGNASCVSRLAGWLKSWDTTFRTQAKAERGSYKAVLITGAPGIGKSTSAALVARESGFHVIELNASDVRNKAALESVVGQLIDNRGLDEFYSASSAGHQSRPAVLIMDEVDGIAGNEDRGGLQQLVQLIKRSRIPIVCIANDASSPKIRTLKQYALQLIWRRPTAEQIAPRLTAIAQAEGLQVDVNAMRRLIESTQADIRQCINFLQMFSQTQRRLDFDSVLSSMQGGAGKDFDVGVFEIVPRFFRDPGRQQAGWMEERSSLYFIDSGLVPLFVQELYLKGRPRLDAAAARTEKQQSVQAMAVVSQAADFISDADTLNSVIYGEQDYSFMPTHALLSSVAPAFLMSGGGGVSGGLGFPVWLGKNSTRMKNARLCREMRTALAVTAPAPSSAFATDFLPALRAALVLPFRSSSNPSATVSSVIEEMDELGLVRGDWDTVKELTDPLAPPADIVSLDPTVKSRFTKAWKAGSHRVRVNRTAAGGEKTAAGAAAVRVAEDELEEEVEDEAESSAEEAEEAEDGQQEGKEGDAAAALRKNPMIEKIKEVSMVSTTGGRGGRAGDSAGKRGRGGGRAAGRGSAGKGSRGRGGGRGRTAARGGGRGRGRGRGRGKSSKDERSEDDEDGDEMAEFIVDDDDDVV